MFQNYYYCLVAGLPDLFLDDSELSFSMEEFKSSLKVELKPSDYKLVELVFLPYDNENLLHVLREEFDALSPLGNFSYEEFETELGKINAIFCRNICTVLLTLTETMKERKNHGKSMN